MSVIDGVVVIDKPAGMTSFRVVNAVRRRLSVKKAGHTGSLDPMATGVLPICLGRATKLAGLIMEGRKVYEGRIRLGISTDTYDADGKVTAIHPVPDLDPEVIIKAVQRFTGRLLQMPPPFSAVKHNGQPLYKLARKGIFVEKAPRTIEVFSFELPEITLPDINFRICCTKGTYIRSIAHELGEYLGTGGHLAALRRVQSGLFGIEQAVDLGRFDEIVSAGRLSEIITPIDVVCVKAETI
ncbi:MAG: tRNA pseudouridine(55) synthase TruB [Dissulfurimicrobium sp.]|uniref:tRNA pseudouridine(55) synthase TruB n=1 Tax=Dissulfurimicrobium TaxID=1769732 RepID=UPI001EDB0068|nr:tRNA pseudouridine(55) synthase TruB [Dissulfurimicrobium hydrothermale]UKL14022.1 tRNA pseudouridine(55) synthase TruB [Dissulfurimicrobium hydrothermale]